MKLLSDRLSAFLSPGEISSFSLRATLRRYPRKFSGRLQVRPMKARDYDGLVDFFRRIPIEERRRFKDNVADPRVLRTWVENLNYSTVLPLLVLDGTRIVGDATLH